jgi:hypothetical protein
VCRLEELKKVEFLPEQNQLINFIIDGANHLDLLYGKKTREPVCPLFEKIIEKVWSGWSSGGHGSINPNSAEYVSQPGKK